MTPLTRAFAVVLLVWALSSTSSALADVAQVTSSVHASTQAKTGPIVGNLAVALTASTPAARVGQPIMIIVELKNVSGKTIYYQPAYSAHITFSTTDEATGVSLPQRQTLISEPGSVRSTGTPLAADHSAFRQTSLTELFDLSKPGTYSVYATVPAFEVARASESWLRSNTISIRVLP